MGLQMEGCHKVWWWLIGAHKYVAPWMQDPQAQKFIVITARKEENWTVILTISHFGLHYFKTWNPLNRMVVFLVCLPFFFCSQCGNKLLYVYVFLLASLFQLDLEVYLQTSKHSMAFFGFKFSIIWCSFGTVASTKSFFSSNPACPFFALEMKYLSWRTKF